MICAELEKLEGELEDIITELEKPGLTDEQRNRVEAAYAEMSKKITEHERSGHRGAPCYEE